MIYISIYQYISQLSGEEKRPQQKETKGQLKNQPRTTIDMPPAVSTRWCPTPEQLMVLEELYRSGVRTPDAPQIQQITAHLSCYGRIEGKNVFYWFQNHKARERQKLRRRLSMQHHLLCAGYPLPLLQPRPLHFFHDHPAAPLTPLLHHHHHHQEHLQPYNMNASQFNPQEGLNLLGKMETKGDDQLATLRNIEACGQEWLARMCSQPPPTSTSKPLKTLDLFPTKSSSSS